MSELWSWSAEELANAVRGRELSAAEVVGAAIERTQQVEPLLGAYLDRFEDEALERAADIDRRCAAGEDPGVLAGVPVALKDNLNVEGKPTTCGSKILEGYVSLYTATAVERLLEAGAVILGKTNLDEFAMGSSCENSAFHPTLNPWNRETVPGGSSGGSAAAVAGGSVPLALGSDTGGSIRQPAAFCGVVGLKPTYGRVSRYGLVAFASSLDQIGPVSRSTRDAALSLSVIAGADPRDATSSAEPVGDYLATLENGVEGLRAGIVEEVDTSSLEPGVKENWEQSLRTLQACGVEIERISLPHLPATIAVYYVIANSEASANLARFDGVRYGHRSEQAGGLMDLYLESREEGFGAEVKRRILLGTFALSSGYYDAYYGRARSVRTALRRQFQQALREVDVILTPTCPSGAFGIGEKIDDPLSMYLSDIYTAPINLAGLPAVAVPSGLDSKGMPLSLQIVGRPFEEATVLRVARAFERENATSFCPPLGTVEGRGAAEAG